MSTTLTILLAGVLLPALAGVTAAALWWRRAYHRAVWRAEHDHLTGLPTREPLAWDLANANTNTVVVLLDLRGFKQINDIYGHEVGDLVLVQVAHRLVHYNSTVGGRAYRLAGDEFVVVWHHWRQLDAATRVATLLDQLAAPLTMPCWREPIVINVHATAGITNGTSRPSRLLRQADIALYHARATGQRLATYHHDMVHPSSRSGRRGTRLRDDRPCHTGGCGQAPLPR